MHRYGAIEGGGTKWVCGFGSSPDNLETVSIPTTTPAETLARAAQFFQGKDVTGLGIGSFGPLDLNPQSPTYGYITSTPKMLWRNFNLVGALRKALGAPISLDTDVNAAALGEHRWGAARGLTDFIYITVGTGIGGGIMAGGRLVHGAMHPEIGHMRIQPDEFVGICPYHGNCLEGIASGPAIQARWTRQATNLPPDHPAWRLEAKYLAAALANLSFTLSPQKIILGGGVMRQTQLFPLIQSELASLLNNYIQAPKITPPALGDRSGILGALALAMAI